MTTLAADPVLDALVRAAADTVGAPHGILVRHEGEVLRVVATAGDQAHALRGHRTPVHAGVAGYVLASGQPLALSVQPGDPRLQEGVTAALPQPPATVLCVPCASEEEVTGALLLLDKAGGPFTFDDVELATVLAGIAGVALAGDGAAGGQVPDPSELGGELDRLFRTDPGRYSLVATLVQALLARG